MLDALQGQALLTRRQTFDADAGMSPDNHQGDFNR
jgi:hypothetical protein